jgi:hypothetical protein
MARRFRGFDSTPKTSGDESISLYRSPTGGLCVPIVLDLSATTEACMFFRH